MPLDHRSFLSHIRDSTWFDAQITICTTASKNKVREMFKKYK